MKWLDITTGEVRSKQEQESRRAAERADDPPGQYRRRVHAALQHVIRPELERWLTGSGHEGQLETPDGPDGTLALTTATGARLGFRGQPEHGTVRVSVDGGGAETQTQELSADMVSPVYVRKLLNGLDAGD
ncbi:MAG TPA: hypothetical protein VFA86_13145 [Gammaproteobacteria bacterium]|nr:hypothetical protein [Gammaproteobacteria bacterium]